MLPPGTDFLLYGAAILGVGLLTASGCGVWLLLKKLRKRTLGTAKQRLTALRKQLKRLYKTARKIQKHIPPSDATFGTNQIPADTDLTFDEGLKNTKNAIENWYASIDRCLRKYIQDLYMSNHLTTSTKDEAYFLSATYAELTETITELFAPKRSITDLFCIFYAMLERQRFASPPPELIRDYTAVSQDMLKQLPRIAERAEAAYAILSRNP